MEERGRKAKRNVGLKYLLIYFGFSPRYRTFSLKELIPVGNETGELSICFETKSPMLQLGSAGLVHVARETASLKCHQARWQPEGGKNQRGLFWSSVSMERPWKPLAVSLPLSCAGNVLGTTNRAIGPSLSSPIGQAEAPHEEPHNICSLILRRLLAASLPLLGTVATALLYCGTGSPIWNSATRQVMGG